MNFVESSLTPIYISGTGGGDHESINGYTERQQSIVECVLAKIKGRDCLSFTNKWWRKECLEMQFSGVPKCNSNGKILMPLA